MYDARREEVAPGAVPPPQEQAAGGRRAQCRRRRSRQQGTDGAARTPLGARTPGDSVCVGDAVDECAPVKLGNSPQVW